MRHRIPTLLLAFLLATSNAFAVFTIRVGDPQKGAWTYTTGTIEEATMTIRPMGLYLECAAYLTFSAKGTTTFGSNDSLEVEFRFELPDRSVVTDSWLWIGDEIAQAKILDRWTATNIYEETVKRRIDPSLLLKNSARDYELRIFPMKRSEQRRVKITWLAPLTWSARDTRADLPVRMLAGSRVATPKMTVLFFPEGPWNSPTMEAGSSVMFSPVDHPTQGAYWQATIPNGIYASPATLVLPAPFENGIFAARQTIKGEQYYQLAVLPAAFYPGEQHRKVCVLVDYQTGNTSFTAPLLMSRVRDALLADLEPTDSFQVMLSSGFQVIKARNGWVPAHPDTIQKVFAEITPSLGNFSNLNQLLPEGIAFTGQSPGPADILLVSNSRQFSTLSAANSAYYGLIALMHPDVPLSIVDFNNSYSQSFSVGGLTFYGNEYLYRNLAQYSGGNYFSILATGANTLSTALSNALLGMRVPVAGLDVYTTMQGGFTYGRYPTAEQSSIHTIHQPVTQIGKYIGNLPLVIQMGGIVEGAPFYREIQVQEQDFQDSDTTLRHLWYGQFLRGIEQGPTDNGIIQSAVGTSIAERVLSRYTAFLCLEDSTYFCSGCFDETILVGTDEAIAPDSLLSAWPNPFVSSVQFKALLEGQGLLEIYAMDGRLVLRQTAVLGPTWGWTWDGTDTAGRSVAPGIYIARLQAGNRQRVVKLLRTTGN
jgi:hypothetical protein